MNTLPLMRWLPCLFLLGACSSQIDTIPEPVVRNTVVTPGGIYFGSISSQSSGDDVAAVALVDNEQRAVLYTEDGTTLISGVYTTAGSGISLQARVFNLGDVKAPTLTLGFEGTFDPAQAVLGSYTRQDGESGAMDFLYQDDAYEKRSATVLLAGTWVDEDPFGASTLSFSINNDGGITGGSMATNCNYNGTLTVIDLRYNIYRARITESCTALPGETGSTPPQSMSGLATLLPASANGARPAELILAFSSSARGRLFRLTSGN